MHSLSNSLKLYLNYKIFGKSQAKIHWKTYEQTLSNFSTTLLLSQASIDILFHTTFLSVSEFVVKNTRKHLLFSRSSCAETLFRQKQLSFLLKSILLLLISATLLYLSTIPSCVCCWWRNKRARNKLLPSIKTLLLLLTKSPNARKFYFSIWFLSFFRFFVFVFWPIETTTANLQGLTYSDPSKILTKSS